MRYLAQAIHVWNSYIQFTPFMIVMQATIPYMNVLGINSFLMSSGGLVKEGLIRSCCCYCFAHSNNGPSLKWNLGTTLVGADLSPAQPSSTLQNKQILGQVHFWFLEL